jgi:hypothetical protein
MNHFLLQSANTSILLTLPRELIYMIAAVDAIVYNGLLRTCRTVAYLFPLSTRLDYMISFGVTVDVLPGGIEWRWDNQLHNIFGPALTWIDGDYSHWWHGLLHREDGPASVQHNEVRWSHESFVHRALDAPAGTAEEILRGAAAIIEYNGVAKVQWFRYGQRLKKAQLTGEQAAQVRAEINYWRAQPQ